MPKLYSYVQFSRPQMIAGKARQRQRTQTKTYAKKHGLVIDESLKSDVGVSAFRVKDAASASRNLAQFMALVTDGTVAKGSVLCIENLGKVNREELTTVIHQLMALIEAGVKVVVPGEPPIEFEKGKWDTVKLMWAIMELSRH